MKIVVLMKQVPDTYGERVLDLETGLAVRSEEDAVLDEIGERALEVAVSHAEREADVHVVVLSMVPESAASAMRKGIAMGAESAVIVADPALRGADLLVTARVLAAALTRIGFDMVIAGDVSTDGSGGVVPAMVAELLDVPQLTGLSSVRIEAGAVHALRATEAGTMEVTADLPAVISITEALPDARFPNFKGIMAAKKKPMEVLTLADLGIQADDPAFSSSIMVAVSEKPPREAGVKITDEGDAGEKLADFLVQNRLV